MQFLVLGMHRSGTSMLTRVLNMMGAHVGPVEELGAPADDNPKGFWERREVVRINDRILELCGAAWHDVSGFDVNKLQARELQNVQASIRQAVSTFDASRPWVLKDPRFSLTLDLWRPCLEAPFFLLCVRRPLEVARSLRTRNDFPLGVGAALWEAYNHAAMRALASHEGRRVVVVDYSAFLDAPIETVASLHEALEGAGATGLRLPSKQELLAFVDRQLNHCAREDSAEEGHVGLQAAGAFYELLRASHLASNLPVPPGLSDWARDALALRHGLHLHERALAELKEEFRCARIDLGAAQQDVESLRKQLGESAHELAQARQSEARSIEAAATHTQRLLAVATAQFGQNLEVLRHESSASRSVLRSECDALRALVRESIDDALERAAEAQACADSRHRQLQHRISEALEDLREQGRRAVEAEERLAHADRLLRQMGRFHRELFASSRWVVGNALARVAEVLMLRGRPRLVADELMALDAAIAAGEMMPTAVIGDVPPQPQWRARAARFGGHASQAAVRALKRATHASISVLPVPRRYREALRMRIFLLQEALLHRTTSGAVLEDLSQLAERRYRPLEPAAAPSLPLRIDLSIVLFRSDDAIPGFVDGLEALDYPLSSVHLMVVDHTPGGGSAAAFERAVARILHRLGSVSIVVRPNKGFGCGHNHNLAKAGGDLFLVCNADGRLAVDSLTQVAAAVQASPADVVAWEMRQIPFEHPKYYDPVTLEASWVSGACTLFRSAALRQCGGFEPRIFMYGEDVELSYRLRSLGWRLRYVPAAVMRHDTYRSAGEFKPLQFSGSTLANMYIRLRYGRGRDIAAIPAMWLALAPIAIEQRQFGAYVRNTFRLAARAGYFLRTRPRARVNVPFMVWDYGLRRDGAFVPVAGVSATELPLVSIVVRTHGDRTHLLRQALRCIANQTYPNIEAVVAEDGGNQAAALCEEVSAATDLRITRLSLPKGGRCAAGNAGLAAARGSLLGFLDDDDLLFSDHVEVLASVLERHPRMGAAYGLAWEAAVRIDEDGRQHEVLHRTLPGQREPFSTATLSHHNLMPIQSVLFRRELFDRYGGFDEALENLEDWDLWRRYSYAHDFLLVEKTTSIYHVPADVGVRVDRQHQLDEYYRVARMRFERFVALEQQRGNGHGTAVLEEATVPTDGQ